jgi:hypothetical protein
VAVFRGDGTGAFDPEVRYALGGSPSSVVTADVNGDGPLDLVVATVGPSLADPGTIWVLPGTGSGGFGSPSAVAATLPRPLALETGDLNADGNLDVVVALYGANSVLVLLGDGTGSFPVSHQYPLVSQSVFSVTIGHLDADSNPDLVTQTDFAGVVWVLLGTGGGSFAAPEYFLGGVGPYATVVADFNEDGRNDVAVATGVISNVALLLGDGMGGLAAPLFFGSASGARWIESADFNSDGHEDVVVAHEFSDSIRLFLGNGKGMLSGPSPFAVGDSPRHLAVADFNRDGRPDVATANFSGVMVSINGLTILPGAIPSPGTVGVAYPSTSFRAAGGVAPHSFSLSGALPADMTFSASTGTISGTPTQAGTFTFTVTGSSSDACTGTRSYSLVVDRAATTVTLSSSANPAILGQPIVLAATVSGAGTPTGTVTFVGEPPTVLGTVPLSGGVATLTISTLPVGTTTVGASYGGDANFLPSAAFGFAQGVVVPEIPTLDPLLIGLLAVLLAAAGLVLARRGG